MYSLLGNVIILFHWWKMVNLTKNGQELDHISAQNKNKKLNIFFLHYLFRIICKHFIYILHKEEN